MGECRDCKKWRPLPESLQGICSSSAVFDDVMPGTSYRERVGKTLITTWDAPCPSRIAFEPAQDMKEKPHG